MTALLLAVVVTQADAGQLVRECERLAADGGVGPGLAALVDEAQQVVAWQRGDYAAQLLAERGLSCDALPTRVLVPVR